MRRILFAFSIVGLVLIGSVAPMPTGSATAQDATSAETVGHPLVGTWLADTEPEDPANALALFIFSADGAYIEVDGDGATGLGRWAATGEQTADLTLLFLQVDDDGTYYGVFKVRASLEVAADGQTFTASYTGEGVAPDGTGTGEYGPGAVTGTRVSAEPMGTPVGPLEELFGIEEIPTPAAATPEP